MVGLAGGPKGASLPSPTGKPTADPQTQVARLEPVAGQQGLETVSTSMPVEADDQEANRFLLACYVLPLSYATHLVNFYKSSASSLLAVIEAIAVAMCHQQLLSGRCSLPFVAFLVWPSLLMRLGMLDRRALFQLVRNFEWWFVSINYAVLALALTTMLAHDLGRLHLALAITAFTLPSLCADASPLRLDRPAAGLVLSGVNVVFLGLACWRRWYHGAAYPLPLFLGTVIR